MALRAKMQWHADSLGEFPVACIVLYLSFAKTYTHMAGLSFKGIWEMSLISAAICSAEEWVPLLERGGDWIKEGN